MIFYSILAPLEQARSLDPPTNDEANEQLDQAVDTSEDKIRCMVPAN